MNIARNSKFNINVNFKKSHGLYLYDNNTQREYLDFFGMYASLPLGYNHDIFNSEEYKEEILRCSNIKINNCEFVSDETLEFDEIFTSFVNKSGYSNFHYTCTGALAVEAAIKTCMHASKYKPLRIISFKNSFHGINSFSCFITDRFSPANKKLDKLPEVFSTKVDADLRQVEAALEQNEATCVIVEPIQCSAGDIHHSIKFFNQLRKLCDHYKVPLVYDEIQVGFGSTGKLWFYEHTNTIPDIVIYGKKTQLSGIMVGEKYADIFKKNNITKLEVTWDGDISDMIRCKYIIKAYEKYDIISNAQIKGQKLIEILQNLGTIKNPRGCGLIIAFDLETKKKRDILVRTLYQNGMLVNKTGEKSIRLRPPLVLSDREIYAAKIIFQKSLIETNSAL